MLNSFLERDVETRISYSIYRKEIRNCAKLKFGDAKGFRKFYNIWVKCEGVLKEQLWNAINTPRYPLYVGVNVTQWLDR